MTACHRIGPLTRSRVQNRSIGTFPSPDSVIVFLQVMKKQPDQLAEGSLISHFVELRDRMIRALAAVLLAFLPCAYFANELFQFIAEPLVKKLPEGGQVIATAVTAGFMTPLKLSMFVALFAAIPYVLFQAWAFVAPGLYRHEKRFAIPLLISSIALFYAGVAFSYTFVFPVMFGFFSSTVPAGVAMMTDISSYLDFVLLILFAFGVAFQIPIAIVILVLIGVVSLDKLRGNRGYVLIAIFAVAAFLTPPDIVSQSLMAVPMYLLYEGGLLMARILSGARHQHSD